MTKIIYQLGFKVDDFPPTVPIVDCRIIRNPFSMCGADEEREKAVRDDINFDRLVGECTYLLLTQYDELIVACSYGRHRSGEVVKEVRRRLDIKNIKVEVIKGVGG